MITETGHFALVLAFVVALAQSVLPLLGVRLGKPGWTAVAKPAALVLFLLLTLSFAALLRAYAVSDFSVENVAMNSHILMPLPYRLAAAWGNHEGSMLLWVWMLSLWGALAALRGKALTPEFRARLLAVQGMIAFGFLGFILFASNPFRRLDPAAASGLGLNPVLQDPALAVHPPLLYTGYVGFSVTFCFAVAALLENKVDRAWAAAVRPFALSAWAALTAGIAMGSLWAYYELGWGGFWFWDPVENASLMPWLCGTALLHALAVLEKRDTLKGWTVFLSILAFSFSLLGTFLVRSGILTSVHAFAVDPARGLFILVLLGAAIGGAFLLFALRAPAVRAGAGFAPFSRESTMLLNNVFLFAFCSTVFMGTLYPVFMGALNLGAVSVGPPYYAAVLIPLLVPFAFLMGAAPHVDWRRGAPGRTALRLLLPFFLTLPVLLPLVLYKDAQPRALMGAGCAAWIFWTSLAGLARRENRTVLRSGMALAHIGFAVFLLGVTGATQGAQEKILWMRPGDRVEMGGRTLSFLGTETGLGPDYNADRGVFRVQDRTGEDVFMTPERRWYPVGGTETGETALRADRGGGVLYLALGDADKIDRFRRVVRLYRHPLVLLVFGGGFLMGLGGLLAACGRRRAEDA